MKLPPELEIRMVGDAYEIIDVNGEVLDKGESLGGAPTEQEAKELKSEILRAMRTGEGR